MLQALGLSTSGAREVGDGKWPGKVVDGTAALAEALRANRSIHAYHSIVSGSVFPKQSRSNDFDVNLLL